MARINIEDTLWSDPRFLKLCVKLGDEEKAIGKVVLAWRAAQKHWCPEKNPIPHSEWQDLSFGEEIIAAGLARKNGKGVYMVGSEVHFSWWFQRQEAGRKGGLAKAKRSPSGTKRALPSSSSSSSSSFSSSSSPSNSKDLSEGAVAPLTVVASPVQFLVKTYIDAWRARYGVTARPDVGGKTQGILGRLVKGGRSPTELAELIQVYCQTQNPWYVKKKHDLATFEQNLNDIVLAHAKGTEVSGDKSWLEIVEERENGKAVVPTAD